LRILIINHLNRWTAAKSYSIKQALWLGDRGHEVWYAEDPENPVDDPRVQELPADMRADFARQALNKKKLLSNAKALARLVKEKQIDLIHTHLSVDHNMALLARHLWRLNVPVFRTKHFLRPLVGGKRFDHRLKYSRLTAGTFTTCELIRRLLIEENGLSPDKVHALFEGVDCNRFRPDLPTDALEDEFALRDAYPVIGIAATLRPDKSHETFLRAAALLADRFPAARFLLIGRGETEYTETLTRLIGELGLHGRAKITGHRSDIAALLARVDLGMVCSVKSDAAGRVVSEWQAAGTPVVVTDIGAYPELIEPGRTGLVVPAQDPKAAADAVASLASSRERLGEMSQAARQRAVDVLSREHFVDELDRHYRRAVAERET